MVRTPGCCAAAQINAWAGEDWVRPFGLYQDERLVAYGELWVDDEEAGVELARLIVDPAERGQGVGRRLAGGLADLARSRYPLVFLRVVPANIAARRCYAAAGFQPAGPKRRRMVPRPARELRLAHARQLTPACRHAVNPTVVIKRATPTARFRR